jgi:predicted pyridoxine 5'-phosphate oxidase superfamily flavin-nucleotide-binding protein
MSEVVSRAWENREGAVILVTVDAQGGPNAIYATCVKKIDEERIVVADNYFSKTRQNLQTGGKTGAVLFMTKDHKAYQVKGRLEYQRTGAVYTDMKKWLDPKFPGHAVAILTVTEAYAGAEKLM